MVKGPFINYVKLFSRIFPFEYHMYMTCMFSRLCSTQTMRWRDLKLHLLEVSLRLSLDWDPTIVS